MGYTNGRPKSRDDSDRDGSFPGPTILVRDILLCSSSSKQEVSVADYTRVPDNIRFEIDDIEAKDWTWADNSFDYIHSRFMTASISSWPRLVRKAFQ